MPVSAEDQIGYQKKLNARQEAIDYIDEFLEKNTIEINSDLQIAFQNHVNVLLTRLSNNECAELSDLSMVDQISKKYIGLAEEMLGPLFEKYHVTASFAEVILIAIYFQTAKEGL